MRPGLSLLTVMALNSAHAEPTRGPLTKVPILRPHPATGMQEARVVSAPIHDLEQIAEMIGRLHFLIDQDILGECQPQVELQGANLNTWLYSRFTVHIDDSNNTSISFGPSIIDPPGGYTFLLQEKSQMNVMYGLSDQCSSWLEIKSFATQELNQNLSPYTACKVTELGVKGGGEILSINCWPTSP